MTENKYDSKYEISPSDIVEFIQDCWKQLIAAGIVGAALGFGGWSFFGTYKAELNLTNAGTNTYGLDLVTWSTLQKSLPYLASQMLADEKLSPEARAMYRQIADAAWWSKGVIPIYSISKADLKDLAGMGKGLEGAGITILGLNIYAGSYSRDSSLNNVRLVAKLIKSGGAYLQVKSILNAYEGEVISAAADIQNQITIIEIEKSYLSNRVKDLEELLKRFPVNAGLNQQMIDIKDADAKYLPLIIQIIAVNRDIYSNKEQLIRLNDRLNQLNLIKQFLLEALPLAATEFDGILLSKNLLSIEETLRKGLPLADVKNRQALDQLRSQLLIVEARFTKGLEANATPVTKKTGMLKATAGGIASLSFLMLVFLLGRKVLGNLKK